MAGVSKRFYKFTHTLKMEEGDALNVEVTMEFDIETKNAVPVGIVSENPRMKIPVNADYDKLFSELFTDQCAQLYYEETIERKDYFHDR